MNAETIIEESKTIQEQVKPHLREAATFFHENEGELFTLEEATGLIASELEIDNTIAARTISQLVGDTVDPVIQVQKDTDKYVGVVEFHEFDGVYGYINYDDQFGKGKRVVCQQCVNEATLDTEVTHATENDPVGSFSGGATWDELVNAVHKHYADVHSVVPENIATGATLASGTTIGGNTSFHAGNESNIDHNNLSNRTHSGDNLTPSSVSSDTLEATDTITDPNGTSHTGELADSAEIPTIQLDGQTVDSTDTINFQT